MRCAFKISVTGNAEQKHVFFVAHSREVRELKSGYIDQIEEESEMEAYVIRSDGPDIADFGPHHRRLETPCLRSNRRANIFGFYGP